MQNRSWLFENTLVVVLKYQHIADRQVLLDFVLECRESLTSAYHGHSGLKICSNELLLLRE